MPIKPAGACHINIRDCGLNELAMGALTVENVNV